MAEKSTFFNSVNGDRKYKAEDMAAHFAKMLTNGVMPAGTQLQVIENSGMNVAVSAGSAWINGYAYHNDANFVLAIDPADGALNRVDRIVVRWSKLARSINLTVLKGTPASSATAPDITRNADYYDLSIATINVNKGITSITQALITDTRMDSDVCGFVSSLIQPDTSGWFVQFETAFNEWFDGVKDMLGNDVAGNLQNQINELHTQVREIKTLSGVVPPTASTVGTVGQFYLDTTTKTLYQCVAVNEGVYTWKNKSPNKIGDILTTTRTDLGDDWLLCNGDCVPEDNYPILAPKLQLGLKFPVPSPSLPKNNFGMLRLGKEKFISVSTGSNSGNSTLRWGTCAKDITKTSIDSNAYWTYATYSNGYFFVSATSSSTVHWCSEADLSSTNTWKTFSRGTRDSIDNLIATNGSIVMYCDTDSPSTLYLGALGLTLNSQYTVGGTCRAMFYDEKNDIFYLICDDMLFKNTTGSISSFAADWTLVTTFSAPFGSNNRVSIQRYDNIWTISDGNTNTKIYYSTDYGATWNSPNPVGVSDPILCFCKLGNYYIVITNSPIYNLSYDFKVFVYSDISCQNLIETIMRDQFSDDIKNVIRRDSINGLGSFKDDDSRILIHGKSATALEFLAGKHIPEISLDERYAYIKAK